MQEALVTFITVADLDRSGTFYGDVLGLPLVSDQGPCRIYRVAAGGFIGICVPGVRTVSPDGVIVTLVRDDVDEFCAAVVARGGNLDGPPRHNPRFGIYHAFLRDPDGYLVEIQRFDEPTWAEPVS